MHWLHRFVIWNMHQDPEPWVIPFPSKPESSWGQASLCETSEAFTVIVLPLPREARANGHWHPVPRLPPTAADFSANPSPPHSSTSMLATQQSPELRLPLPAVQEVQSIFWAGDFCCHTQAIGHRDVSSMVNHSLLPLPSSFHGWKIRKWSHGRKKRGCFAVSEYISFWSYFWCAFVTREKEHFKHHSYFIKMFT